jgi:hypothetical protein
MTSPATGATSRPVPEHVASYGNELLVTPVNPLLARTVIRIDEPPWVGYLGPGASEPSGHVFTKTLIDPASGHFCMVVRIEAGAAGPPHWHRSDTVYIVRRGELHVPGEGVYREGDLRWVQGGFAYGGEIPGPDGVEFIFLSLGPYGWFDPEEHPPPLGRWDAAEPGPAASTSPPEEAT